MPSAARSGPASGVETLCDNRAPVLSVPSLLTTEAGKTLRFRVAALDHDGDAVALGIAGLPDGATFDSSTGLFTMTPRASCDGRMQPRYDVTFVAADSSSTAAPRGMQSRSAPGC